MLCQSYLSSTVISFLLKDKWRWFILFISCFASLLYWVLSQALYTKTNGGSIKACQLFSVKKIFEKILLFPRHIELNLVMSLKRLSVEAWQNKKHYSTGNNTSKNPIPRQEISNQSTMWSTQVRSGQVRSQHCCLCSFPLELSSSRVKLQLHTRFIGYDSFQTRWFISYRFQICTIT